MTGQDDDVCRFEIRITSRVPTNTISVLISRPRVPVSKMADGNARYFFMILFLVLGRVEGLLGKTFRRGAQRKDLLHSNYIQLESSVNSANLRKNIAICARVVSAQFC